MVGCCVGPKRPLSRPIGATLTRSEAGTIALFMLPSPAKGSSGSLGHQIFDRVQWLDLERGLKGSNLVPTPLQTDDENGIPSVALDTEIPARESEAGGNLTCVEHRAIFF